MPKLPDSSQLYSAIKKYQKLKGTLNFLIKEEELKSKEIDKLITDNILEGIKDLKEDLLYKWFKKSSINNTFQNFNHFLTTHCN